MSDDDTRLVADWLTAVDDALRRRDTETLKNLLVDDSHWRDLVALTWDIRTTSRADTIATLLADMATAQDLSELRVSPEHTAPRTVTRAGREVVEAFFTFRTRAGDGVGVVRLDAIDRASPRAWTVLTTLQRLRADVVAPPVIDPDAAHRDPLVSWRDERARRTRFEDREPEVVIIGAGQGGLALAARLGQLGVDTLLIEGLPRVGDNWRNRYESLALHTQTSVSHLPYIPFPSTFPPYLPKDKLADWLEGYASAMELQVWTSTEFSSAEFDSATRCWTVHVRTGNGSVTDLHPRHLVMATGGVGGTPLIPDLPGLQTFSGDILHTKSFRSGRDYEGHDVLVVGTGTSGHDAAYDLQRHGARVTMLQRSPTTIVSMHSANLPLGHYAGMPLDEADLIGAAGFTYPVLRESLTALTEAGRKHDSELLDALAMRGFRTDSGHDGTGYLLKSFRYGGGYYINVGASDAIADGSIGVLDAAKVEIFTSSGLRLTDGSVRELDAVILATGYANQQTDIRRFFGDAVADALGPIFGLDPGGEVENAWKPTAQDALWIMVGGLGQARTYSRFLALQLTAAVRGIHPRYIYREDDSTWQTDTSGASRSR